MAAQVAESDMDLAFRLQLEEAMAASIGFSSTSQTQSQHPPPLVSNDNAEGNLVYLQIMEIDSLETEIQDRMLVEAETKKMQVDFHRRIRDRKLAREIMHMTEDQWQVFCNNVERPYGEGTSSSKGEEHSEVFRVYFKGLLVEETVIGSGSTQKSVTLAGIGVAICDWTDELIFEMRKPLDLVEDDQDVEGMALIEALNAAAALDLQRIIFYCDCDTLYQYVNGQLLPTQEKFRTFVNHFNHLRESFTYCVPSLVAQNDLKFAFKLAREAISSQINKAEESSHDKLENCVICLDDKYMDQFFPIDGCKHRYCFSCLKQHVEVKLLDGMVPKCPQEGCEFELGIKSCEILVPKLVEMMRQRQNEASIPMTEKIYCPYPKCSALMSKIELLPLPRFIYVDGARTCNKCYGDFCINCRVPWHKDMNCAEYKRRNPNSGESELTNLAAKNLWRQCIKCKHMIELAAGCNHMTCRCGHEFCYTCGAEWRNKNATCTCPLWDDRNIMDDDEHEDDYL